MTPQEVQQLIENGLPDAQATVYSEDNSHFDAVVVCAAFADKSMVKQHQMVYAILGEFIQNNAIHALNIKTYTPEQYANQPQ